MTYSTLSGTVVVTGGTRGLGRAISERLARAGATVVLTGTNADTARTTAADIAARTGATVHGLPCDVSVEASVAACAESVLRLTDTVSALVNNAGISGRSSLTDLTRRQWDRVMAVNATGSFLMAQALLPMLGGPNPSIVNISSQAGQRGEALLSHYAASKAAQIGFTLSLARELAPRIRVNAVLPGLVETDMVRTDMQSEAERLDKRIDDIRSMRASEMFLGRLQTVDSIAAAVHFLVSDDARDITGHCLPVTGGLAGA